MADRLLTFAHNRNTLRFKFAPFLIALLAKNHPAHFPQKQKVPVSFYQIVEAHNGHTVSLFAEQTENNGRSKWPRGR